MSDIQSDTKLDARGRRCSMLSMMVAQEIAPLAPGTIIEVLTDDPGAPKEMPAWCNRTGHDLLSVDQEGQEFRIAIKRGR